MALLQDEVWILLCVKWALCHAISLLVFVTLRTFLCCILEMRAKLLFWWPLLKPHIHTLHSSSWSVNDGTFSSIQIADSLSVGTAPSNGYNRGPNKMEQQTPTLPPPKSRMKPRKSQNAPFSYPWFGGGGWRGGGVQISHLFCPRL